MWLHLLILLNLALFTPRTDTRCLLLHRLWSPSFVTGVTLGGTLTGMLSLESLFGLSVSYLMGRDSRKRALPLNL